MGTVPNTIGITGGAGFVGQHLVRELSQHWPTTNVISWDLPEVDVTKPETLAVAITEAKPDWIVHLAAIASVPAALKNPNLVQQVNGKGTRNLLEAVKQHSPATKVLFVSTADVYGMSDITVSGKPVPELSLFEARPANPYSQSKWDAEMMIEERYGEFVLRVRPFPHVGPGQGKGFVTADFASQIAAIEQGKQDPVIGVGNLEAKRDFTDVRDVARAYRLLIERGEVGGVYNVASGGAVAIQTILDMLLGLSKTEISIQQDPARMRPSDIPMLVGDATKLRSDTQWQPSITLKESLQDVLDWWRANS